MTTIRDFIKDSPAKFMIIFYLVLIFVPVIISWIYYYYTRFTRIITIKKVHHFSRQGTLGLMFEDTDENNYKLTRFFFKGEFKTLEYWNLLKPAQQYRVHGWGIRHPFLNLYPQVYKVDILEVSKN